MSKIDYTEGTEKCLSQGYSDIRSIVSDLTNCVLVKEFLTSEQIENYKEQVAQTLRDIANEITSS
jgi:flagellar biosynthesis/type III secretory pathway protein FliH